MVHPPLQIVYAEDDDLVRDVVSAALRELGATVHGCNNGAEAVLFCLSVNPDVALLDLTMLGMDGFDGARRIRENEVVSGKRVRLVALTGRDAAQYREQADAAGFDEFITKPVSVETLEGALARWRGGAAKASA
jgi:CheY-like chemotaxis protein